MYIWKTRGQEVIKTDLGMWLANSSEKSLRVAQSTCSVSAEINVGGGGGGGGGQGPAITKYW